MESAFTVVVEFMINQPVLSKRLASIAAGLQGSEKAILVDDLSGLEAAIGKSLINIESKTLTFIEPNTVKFFKGYHLLESMMSESSDFNTALKGNRLPLSSEFFVLADKLYSIDILSALAEQNDRDLWRIYMGVCDALVFCTIDMDKVESNLSTILTKTQGDGFGNKIYFALSAFAEHQPDQAQLIIDIILQTSESKTLSFLPAIFKGISTKNGPETVWDQLVTLSANPSLEVENSALVSIANLPIERSKDVPEVVERILAFTDKKLASGRTDILGNIAGIYENLLSKSDIAKKKLLNISETDDPQTLFIIAKMLYLFPHNKDVNWYRTMLLKLCKVLPGHNGTLQMIDGILRQRLNDNPALAIEFIEGWIETDPKNYRAFPIFKLTFQQLYRVNPDLLQITITTWLNRDNFVFQVCVTKILSDFYTHGILQLTLSEAVLKPLEYKDVKFIVLKILGFVIHKNYLQNFLFKILAVFDNDSQVRGLIEKAFKDYIIYNYPSALKFLDEVESSASVAVKQSIKKIKRCWKAYAGSQDKLNKVNEFQASEIRLKAYFTVKHKEFKKAHDETQNQENSIFNLAHVVDVKAGKKMFHKKDGIYSEKRELSLFSFEGELPRAEDIDPVGQARLRLIWKTYKRQ